VAEAKENQEFALELQAETGCVLHESYTIWKLLWLKKYQPQVFQKAYKFLSLADYLTYRLTGEFATSYAIASTTGLFNINSLTWDSSILEFLGISQSQLASCFEITHTEKISSKTMHELGFEEDLLLVLGAGDGPLSNLGTGCFSNAKMCSSVGTSSALRIMANSEANHSSVWKYYFDEQSYISGIAINAGFSSLFWVYQNIFQEDAAHILSDLQELDLDAMNEIIFLPFLDGERGPNYQQNMAGSFWGLKSNHGKKDILKAVVEGIFFNLYQCYQIIIEKKNLPSEIVAAGGYVNSAAMLQMQADIFNVKIVVPTIQEASAVGAAIVSLKGMGVISSLSSIKTVSKNLCIPNSAKHQEYMVKYKKYKKIYNMTLNILKEI
jgi:gluconokinase